MLRWTFNLLLAAFLVATAAAAIVVWYLVPGLPAVDALRDMRLQVPMRVYTGDGVLIGEFGEKRRIPVSLTEVPDIVVKAFLDAEDDRFYEHPGVDWQGIIRATASELRRGDRGQGGSTITQQVARAYFLSPEKTYIRKIREMLLALKIEKELSKDEILALYLNTIFLGQRAYGIGAAAQVYYGKGLSELTLAEVATIAGIPPAPSAYNPVTSPKEALKRRSYVLRRLLEKQHISREQYDLAMAEPIETRVHGLRLEAEAPDIAEMVRQQMVEKYGEETAMTSGYRVYTSVDSKLQAAATRALRGALMEYDRRHGYRGPERNVQLPPDSTASHWQQALQGIPALGGLQPAIVTRVGEQTVGAYTAAHGTIEIGWRGLSWAAPYVDKDHRGRAPRTAADILKPGDVIRVQLEETASEGEAKDAAAAEKGAEAGRDDEPRWRLVQVPVVQGALVSISASDGAIQAMVGGFDFQQSKFNRVTQALRQPGSNFKPFLYSAALDAGFTPASLINDAPVVFDTPGGVNPIWRPENYGGEYNGPTRLREALSASRNLVSIRLLSAVGIDYVADYARRFGFANERLPRDLSLALGTGVATPLEVVRGYSVFANGGYLVDPYLIKRVETIDGVLVMEADPVRVCTECETAASGSSLSVDPMMRPARIAPRVIGADNAWMMNSMMQDVIKAGTARRALALKRKDLAGKTGTTNEQRDAWFSGFNAKVATTVWVGFDQVQPLGRDETGARAALPMWMKYMSVALDGMEEATMPQPQDLVTVRIDPATGNLARSSDADAVYETFRSNEIPLQDSDDAALGHGADVPADQGPEQLF
ncbi:MAG: penicillin-binding protein 1A [Gammaproteobacteria bacterium]|nr:penicillin-binding protein 1A [Gammaproteobacteria bacterium]